MCNYEEQCKVELPANSLILPSFYSFWFQILFDTAGQKKHEYSAVQIKPRLINLYRRVNRGDSFVKRILLKKLLGFVLLSSCFPLSTASAVSPFNCGGTCYSVAAGGYSNGQQAVAGGNDGVTQATATLNALFPGYGSAIGTFSSDLSSGAVRAKLDTTIGGGGNATLSEIFMFDLPTGMTTATAHVTWTIEGTNVYGSGGSANGLGAFFRFINSSTGNGMIINDLNFSNTSNFNLLRQSGFHSFVYEADVIVNEINRFRVDSQLFVGLNGSGSMDYGNTSYFNLQLPDGVTLISSSGVLLSNPISSVPEPASWAMLIVGFSVVGIAARRRKAVAAP